MIVIIDYGMGNLRSVQKGFERVGHEATISRDPDEVARATKLVLPGVGAFSDAMAELRARGLVAPIVEAARAGRRLLGICLGLQLLFERSFEDGCHEGLGLIAGDVVRFELPPPWKVPHMGWNEVRIVRRAPIFAHTTSPTHMYFVHSYYVVPQEADVIATETDYGVTFASSVWRENLVATQFHPEKSQSDGLQLLADFAAW